MAVSTRTPARQRDYSRLFIALAVLAAVVAIAPIAAALFGYGPTVVTPSTAFATAPGGAYAVLGRSDDQADVISVAPASNPGAVSEIARIPHLRGFTSTGSVSPDGRHVALVSVDGGSPAHPTASLNIVALETGLVSTAVRNIVPGQSPVWSRDNLTVAVSRMPMGNESRGPIHLISVSIGARPAERLIAAVDHALGVFPVGYSPGGHLVSVVIDARGSVLRLDDSDWGVISSGITRDWKLAPDGSELAFIDAVTDGGLQYRARSVALSSHLEVASQALSASVSALGTAWNPVTRTATFGIEPILPSNSSSVDAQSLIQTAAAVGFDVPMAYSNDGKNLAVTRWSGRSFLEPGKPVIQIVSESGRTNYESFTRFYGWSAR